MKYFHMFFDRIITDFRQKKLLSLKLLFFIQTSTVFVLYPYLTIHMRELGINIEETAIMYSVIPIIAIIMPPLAGMMADKIGNFKILLALFSALGGLSSLLLLLVPVGRVSITHPLTLVMDLSCENNLTLSTYAEQFHCELKEDTPLNVNLSVQSCGYVCPSDLLEKAKRSRNLNYLLVAIEDESINRKFSLDYYIPTDFESSTISMEKLENHKVLKINDRFNSSLRKLSESLEFFPLPDNNVLCQQPMSINDTSDMNKRRNISTDIFQTCSYELADFNNTGIIGKKTRLLISPLEKSNNDIGEKISRFSIKKIIGDGGNIPIPKSKLMSCLSNNNEIKSSVKMTAKFFKDSETNVIQNCSYRCLATVQREDICSNMKDEINKNISLTFWSYLVIRVLIGIIGGSAFAMFEGAAIAILREQKADYGLQRVYALIGGMISSPLSGFLIDYASKGKGYTDFRPAFYLYTILKVSSAVLMLKIDLEFKPPASKVVREVITVLKNAEMIALLVACFILGSAWGYIESFLFWLIQDLGGSRSLMGITITVGGIAGIPLLVLSGPIIDRIGHANVIFIGFIFYAIRLVGYSMIYNPWLCLVFEAMESITSSLAITAAVTYAAKLSTNTTDSSIQGLIGGLYFGVGKGIGSLIGGFLINSIGARETYQVFAGVTAITGVLYFIYNNCCVPRIRYAVKEEQKVDIANNHLDSLGEIEKNNLKNCKTNTIQTTDQINKIKSILKKSHSKLPISGNLSAVEETSSLDETNIKKNDSGAVVTVACESSERIAPQSLDESNKSSGYDNVGFENNENDSNKLDDKNQYYDRIPNSSNELQMYKENNHKQKSPNQSKFIPLNDLNKEIENIQQNENNHVSNNVESNNLIQKQDNFDDDDLNKPKIFDSSDVPETLSNCLTENNDNLKKEEVQDSSKVFNEKNVEVDENNEIIDKISLKSCDHYSLPNESHSCDHKDLKDTDIDSKQQLQDICFPKDIKNSCHLLLNQRLKKHKQKDNDPKTCNGDSCDKNEQLSNDRQKDNDIHSPMKGNNSTIGESNNQPITVKSCTPEIFKQKSFSTCSDNSVGTEDSEQDICLPKDNTSLLILNQRLINETMNIELVTHI